ncbi:Cysteinyl-tRNA synthetase [hydrothermal vent metagenome]|uniref:Cysteine--tRNA ligase n=1 Tax=hydrothermal vent metagenome TaxID=652676 RepID=A0A3B1AGS0_9ZZZZ
MLHIYNTLSRKKEQFKPIDKYNIRLYVCGMTIYDYCHIGHARMLLVFDMVYRYLCLIYGKDSVRYIRNITDIDDKIIARANENNETIDDLTERFIDAMHDDLTALGILPPDDEPRATLHMQQIIAMIQTLIDKKIAYQGSNGDVYYDVSAFPSYGRLSGKILDDLRAGARVEVAEAKDDPLDFVLWKMAKVDEPFWESPWGNGRPGWHIECSAMSTHCLGNHFDIHGGGMDLQFPHHENEIAQSEAATGEQFVNTWMHNGFVRVDNEKMSKSLNNFFTIRDVVKQYEPEVIRYFILTSHYRSPLNYSDVHLDSARASLTTLYTAMRGITLEDNCDESYLSRFKTIMDDDFNTSEALSLLHELSKKLNIATKNQSDDVLLLASTLKYLAGILGLLTQNADDFLKGKSSTDSTQGYSDAEIEQLINDRVEAKNNKDWSQADTIRTQLQEQGVILEDSASGTTWRRE